MAAMIIKKLATGMFSSNCYIVSNNGTGVVIDPGADTIEIAAKVKELDTKVSHILLTHGHIDHMVSVDELRDLLGAKVAIHKDEERCMTSPYYNGSVLFGLNRSFRPADILLNDNDIIDIGGLEYRIIHTPGHTMGGICILAGDSLFTGDTLFYLGIGRTDLGGGDMDQLLSSIKNRLFVLPEDTVVHPGHGKSSTIGYEKANNTFL